MYIFNLTAARRLIKTTTKKKKKGRKRPSTLNFNVTQAIVSDAENRLLGWSMFRMFCDSE